MISMNELVALANALIEADSDVTKAEDALKEKKEVARRLREEALPCALQELGCSNITLENGKKVSVKQEVYLAIPAGNKDQCFTWLEEHDFGGMIKTEVKASFGRGELEVARELQLQLQNEGLEADLKRDVHAQTLKAWAREQLSEGREFPMDLFGARPVWTATVK